MPARPVTADEVGSAAGPAAPPPAPVGTTGPRRSRRRSGRRLPDAWFAAALMAPAAAFLGLLVAWPLARLVADSFYDISPFAGGPRTFVGLHNYTRALTSADFLQAGVRTVAYTVVVVALEFALGLAVALAFTALGRRSAVFRTAFMYPLMIAPVVAGLLWRFLLIDNIGIVNHLLAAAHVIGSADDISWLADPDIVLFAVAVPDVWLTTSFMTLVLFAGLQNIPGELVEAARLDGAGPLTLLWRIVLPLLRPVIAVAVVVRGIDAAKAFDIILIQTQGGPQNASTTLSLLIYRTMIRFGEPGLASAMSTLYLVVMLAVAFVAVLTIWRPGARA